MSGRTLYIGTGDVGLTFTSGAKAVVIQNENYKDDVKTEYSSVNAAISALVDVCEDLTGLQFTGRIAGRPNSQGVAEWIVFLSDTDLVSGGNGGNGGSNNGNRTGKFAIGIGGRNIQIAYQPDEIGEAAEALVNALENAGYTDVEVDIDGGGIGTTTGKRGGVTTTFSQ